MGKRLPYTPRSQIRSALRRYVWLRSRERLRTLQRDGYRCVKCGAKQSKAKGKEVAVEVHHRSGYSGIDKLIDLVYEHLLPDIDNLETLCKSCHLKEGDQNTPQNPK